MPNDHRGNSYNYGHKDLITIPAYSTTSAFHPSAPPEGLEYESAYGFAHHHRLPLPRLLRFYIAKIVQKKGGPEIDRIMKWALKKWANVYWMAKNFRKCQRSGRYSDALFDVYSKNEAGSEVIQRWCLASIHKDGYHCAHSGARLDKAKFPYIEISNGQMVQERYKGSYHFWEEEWHTGTKEQMEKRIADYLIAQKRTGDIPHYHNIQPLWRNKKVSGGEVLIGVELEVLALDSSRGRRRVCDEVEEVGFIGETDGSLDHLSGIEIVGKPLDFKTITSKEGPWLKLLDKIGPSLAPLPHNNYGMHISVSRGAMAEDHQIRFCCFVHRNKRLCEKIGDRAYCYDPHKPMDEDALAVQRSAAGPVGPHRIEVRLFRSVTKEADFLRNVEFTAAGVEFTRNSGDKLTEAEFLSWLPQRAKTYPNLCRFLGVKEAEKPKTKRPKTVRVG